MLFFNLCVIEGVNMKDYVTNSYVRLMEDYHSDFWEDLWEDINGRKVWAGKQYTTVDPGPTPSKEEDPYGIPAHAPGSKLDNGKVMVDLLLDFNKALLAVAEVSTFGARKYSRGGWKHVPDGYHRYTAAMMRHWLLEPDEEVDSDSKLSHQAHVCWNSLARLELLLRGRNERKN